MLVAASGAGFAQADVRRNWFGDPFAQATHGLPACPRAAGPLLTEAEMRREAHQRVERGTTCWLAGNCPEPNAYAGDARINDAATRVLASEGRLRDTRLWVITQRRFVFVQGCVGNPQQKRLVLVILRRVPGVEYVSDEMLVGTTGRPPYAVAGAASSRPAAGN
jgi:hypothetical protein